MIILEVTKKQGFNFYLENTIVEEGEAGETDLPQPF